MADSRNAWPPPKATSAKKRRGMTKFVIGGAVFALAVAYMIFSAAQASGVYYLTIKELQSGAAGNGPARVAGKVMPGTVEYDSKTLNANFKIGDGAESLPVSYKGVLPDAFQPDVDVIIEGRYTPGQPFQAKEILTKCPSKYEDAVAEPVPSK